MRFQYLLAPFLARCYLQAVTEAANNTAAIDLNSYPEGTFNATAWALVYTYPLAIFASWAGGVLRNVSVNQIFHQRDLATLENPGVIKPNIDTLYSRAVLDLSKHDVVLTVPNITGRYYVYPVYDSEVLRKKIGVVSGNKPGEYLIRRAEDAAVQPGFSHSSVDATNKYQGVVTIPTTYATMLIRILLLRNTTEDLNTVHTYQNASHLREINRTTPQWQSSQAPALQSTALSGTLLGIHTPAQQFEFAARIIEYNQPENYTDRARVASILARAGLYNGHYHPQHSINLTQAAVIANSSMTAYVNAYFNVRPQGNDWQLQTPPNQGNYGTRYPSAAYVALNGYQQLNVQQTLYPGYKSLGFTSTFTLAQNQSLLVTFSGKPKLKEYGFWSLSVYGSDQYLIRNPLYRYSVSDRTLNLKYEDGSYIYGPNANETRDDVFHILVQDVNIPPPVASNWTSNWLPVDASFSLILRWYVPEDAMTNGSYVYPVLRNITAIASS